MMLSDTLHLRPRLARVLDALENAHGSILSHAQIETAIRSAQPSRGHYSWTGGGEDNNVKVAIHQIRRKLRAVPMSRDIETIWGRGYRLVDLAGDR
jgi:DNA-binding winged helix-turn-helix (wHTH) protein